MLRFAFSLSVLLVVCSVTSAQEKPRPDHAQRMKAGTAIFRQSVRAALIKHCLKCHGGEKTRSGLDLSSRESLLKGSDSGQVVDLKDPSESYLLQVIRHDEEPAMPPADDKLSSELIDQFAKWIELGAPYDKPLLEKTGSKPKAMQVTDSDRQFWSFRPLANDRPPEIDDEWIKNDIDRFVLAKLHEQNLTPSSSASQRDRIRRTYLDLIGLPPTPQQITAAMSMSQDALIDQLLQSPHYGQRWARHWLDAARFAESHGFEQDYDRKFAYHYRDFVIKALNSDMPWDQFVRWQIAGDEIAPDDPLAMMATGFLGAGVFPTQLTEKEFESARYDELDDMAATVGTAMLGLTVGCARCHDHKFDPLPVEDYYRFVSTFTTTIRSEVDIDLDPTAYQKQLAEWQTAHDKIKAEQENYERDPAVRKRFDDWLATEARQAINTSQWTVLPTLSAESSQQATTLKPQDDGAILASGKAPAKETYTVRCETQLDSVRSIRIEALTHKSMNRGGPGRAGNGNFALSDFRVFVIAGDDGDRRKQLKLASAKATHQQNETNLSVASSFDSDLNGTGWAVDFGGIGKDQAAVFYLAEPLQTKGRAALEFRLRFSNNGQHSLGRFRVSVSSDPDPKVAVGDGQSESLRSAIAALESGQLQQQHRDTLFPLFAKNDPTWIKLSDATQTSLSKKPRPSKAKVQVSSEGFPPTKHHADGRGFPHFYSETHFLNRGDPNQKKGVASSGFLQVLMRGGKASDHWQQAPPADWTRTSYRRTGMADWITDAEFGAGHLLARVIVNRLWHHHFGRGIVATPNDFGLQGTPPTHPELLDYLANKLIANGWRLKPLHKEILESAVWLQSKTTSEANAKIDPENQWLWRYPNRRLEAEVVRDAMLFASGQLDERMFGPGTLDANHRRRSIYFMIKRSRLVPMMQIFDQPEPLSSQGSRPSTTIAPQALLFMNNAQVVNWSSALAASVADKELEPAVNEIYLRTLSREPTADELQQVKDFVGEQSASYDGKPNARRLALADFCQILFGLNEFIYLP